MCGITRVVFVRDQSFNMLSLFQTLLVKTACSTSFSSTIGHQGRKVKDPTLGMGWDAGIFRWVVGLWDLHEPPGGALASTRSGAWGGAVHSDIITGLTVLLVQLPASWFLPAPVRGARPRRLSRETDFARPVPAELRSEQTLLCENGLGRRDEKLGKRRPTGTSRRDHQGRR